MTNTTSAAIINHACSSRAGIAQLVEQLICNQQVGGSSPSTSSTSPRRKAKPTAEQQRNMGEFPSGQRGQTVNLLALPSVVRIHLPPPTLSVYFDRNGAQGFRIFASIPAENRGFSIFLPDFSPQHRCRRDFFFGCGAMCFRSQKVIVCF